MTNVLRKSLIEFGPVFRERLIQQLDHDFKLTERQEIGILNDLADVVISKSNNDRRIMTTINHLIGDLKCMDYESIDDCDDVRLTSILNDRPLGTKLFITNRKFRDFFVPADVVREFLK